MPEPTPPANPRFDWQQLFFKLLTLGAVSGLVLWLVVRLSVVTVPILTGLFIAYALNPVVVVLRRWRVPSVVALGIPLLAVFSLTAIFVAFILPSMAQEVLFASQHAPQKLYNLVLKVDPWFLAHFGQRLSNLVDYNSVSGLTQSMANETFGHDRPALVWVLSSARDIAMAFGARSLPRSRRTAVLTNAGGPGILAADAMEAAGLTLVELSEPTVAALRPMLPAEASIRNPLDMVASATPPSYAKALTALLADPNVDAVVPIFVPPYGIKQEDVADAIATAAKTELTKPILAVLMGREGLPAGRADLLDVGVPTYVFPESVARALRALNRHVEWAATPPSDLTPLPVDGAKAATIIESAMREKREHLTQMEALDLLEAYGIGTARLRMVTAPAQLAEAAAAVGYPLVMKIVSPDIVHKTDVGGVTVGLRTEADVRAAYDAMMTSVATRAPGATISGVLLQQMRSGGREFIAGIVREPGFGPLIMFGLGGVLVEALRDVVFRMVPIGDRDADEMLDGIRGTKLLGELRGDPAVDRVALMGALRRIAQLGNDFPQIAELDANPLLASAAGVVALDARVRLAVVR